jgi:dTDP-4-amino-4,6-dideoxygalactose transaminase
MQEVPFNLPDFDPTDLAFFHEAISNGHSSGNGSFTKKAEDLIAQETGCARALLTTSCTHALELSAQLCKLKPGDEVIVPSYTFVSTASAFALFGVTPVFVDSEMSTLNIDPKRIVAAITNKTRAICVVHYGGVACDLEQIVSIANEFDLTLIEDNAHGMFASYKGRSLGTFGSLATQSFHETKNLTCGEGGALLINNDSLIESAEVLREKGTNRSRFMRGQVDKYTWVDVGSSWVMSDLLAAILWGQLQRAPLINAHRLELWNRYHVELSGWATHVGVIQPFVPDGASHVGHLYHIRFQQAEQRTRFIEFMRSQGIWCVFHYQPLHLSPVGIRLGRRSGQYPVAEHAGDCLVRLPLFNKFSVADQCRVIDAVKRFRP